MKARSVIFTHQQFPPSIFGLPPMLAIGSCAAGAVAYIATVIAGFVPVALIVASLVTVIGLVKAYRLGKADRHVESVFLTTLKFWGFNSTCRGLTTGAPPERSHQGGRS
ncbi:MAG: hypothetical protein LDL39_11405 [Magnetospirillum sp.]|nr:hypothetical protein [Magnetospirillum sp.]